MNVDMVVVNNVLGCSRDVVSRPHFVWAPYGDTKWSFEFVGLQVDLPGEPQRDYRCMMVSYS